MGFRKIGNLGILKKCIIYQQGRTDLLMRSFVYKIIILTSGAYARGAVRVKLRF